MAVFRKFLFPTVVRNLSSAQHSPFVIFFCRMVSLSPFKSYLKTNPLNRALSSVPILWSKFFVAAKFCFSLLRLIRQQPTTTFLPREGYKKPAIAVHLKENLKLKEYWRALTKRTMQLHFDEEEAGESITIFTVPMS